MSLFGIRKEKKKNNNNNIMKIIAEGIGVRLNEEFCIRGESYICKISEEDFLFMTTDEEPEQRQFRPMPREYILSLLTGEAETIINPFKPMIKENFWTYNENWAVVCYRLNMTNLNFMVRIKTGIIFRTKSEALRKREFFYEELTGTKMRKDETGKIINPKKQEEPQTQKEEIQKKENLNFLIKEGADFFLEGKSGIYRLIDDKLFVCEPNEEGDSAEFVETQEPIPYAILTGKIKKKRNRFVPKPGEKFYSYDDKWNIKLYTTKKPNIDFLCRIKTGIVFNNLYDATIFKKTYFELIMGEKMVLDEKNNPIIPKYPEKDIPSK